MKKRCSWQHANWDNKGTNKVCCSNCGWEHFQPETTLTAAINAVQEHLAGTTYTSVDISEFNSYYKAITE